MASSIGDTYKCDLTALPSSLNQDDLLRLPVEFCESRKLPKCVTEMKEV